MAKRNAVAEAGQKAGDRAEEAGSLLKRLIDEAPLRDAVEKLINEGAETLEELPAKGRKARREAQRQLKAARVEVTKRARKQQRQLERQARKQGQKLERKGAAAAAEVKVAARQKRGGLGRIVLLGGAGGIGAIALSESLRSKVLDLLFGAEEEFQYTPPAPTQAPSVPPVPPVA